ncbi:rRNA N6-adenosine-methyltransferase ZCCHC4-like isoform X2 [Nilaparvata lugens]|uniref:rRNA N6-adenosine-methyltransferase ZCCHC4-like isoform X2 n=1 Tax=Nilaparvata lugens TaxID=108931 RepID=UPI00193E8F26|nr:rRNA N6-adenosine-methyltransferase ZCCHC4-like isoform X2 [Nilaparvata lugens]
MKHIYKMAQSKNSAKSNTGLKIDCENLENNPHCPHGPTLLYKRLSNGKETQEYYACSSYQNRKDCSFMFVSRSVEERKKQIVIRERRKLFSDNVTELRERLKRLKKAEPSERFFCSTCSCLIFLEEQNKHAEHSVKNNVTDYQLTHPSQLLLLQSDSKREAQFMFSVNTVDVILGGLKALNFKKLICIGTPTIHERVMECKDGMESILLDIDHRYIQFYSGDHQFCWFNMMNCFPMKGQHTFDRVRDFLHCDDVVVLMDPPFSARSEPLAYTLTKLDSVYQQQMRDNPLPARHDMVMLDYDVKYTNHKKFNESDKTSVIRMFTNLDASKFVLPESEGYRYCKKCNRWISKHNKHCFKCKICPSKNGQPYKHCNVCNRCVKQSWQHCHECNRCALTDHPCHMWQTTKVQKPEKIVEKTVELKRRSSTNTSKAAKKRKKTHGRSKPIEHLS